MKIHSQYFFNNMLKQRTRFIRNNALGIQRKKIYEDTYNFLTINTISWFGVRNKVTSTFVTQITNYPNSVRSSNLIGVKRLESVVSVYMVRLLLDDDGEWKKCNPFESKDNITTWENILSIDFIIILQNNERKAHTKTNVISISCTIYLPLIK